MGLGNCRWAAVLAAALPIAAVPAAFADEAQLRERLDRLEQRVDGLEGAIKERDAKIETLKKAVAERNAQIESLEKATAQAPKRAANKGSAVVIQSPDGNLKFAFRGRIQEDVGVYNDHAGKRDFNSGTLTRRARMGLDGEFYDDWAWRIEAEFAQGNGVTLTDAYVNYKGLPRLSFIMGQHKTPYTLEDRTSANFITFMERGLFVDAFNAGANRKIGISAKASDKHWNGWLGFFGENAQVNGPKDEGWGINGNFGIAPVNEQGKLLHLGASAYYRGKDASGTTTFADTPEIQVDSTKLVSTGAVPAEHYRFTGGEIAAVYGPFSVQGEYGRATIDRSTVGRNDVSFDGFYVYASYFLTGESRPFKGGAFDRITPKANFSLSKGGAGAWEIAARMSRLDLTDKDILGGKEMNYTLALNWYFNPNMHAAFNWVRFLVDNTGKPDERADAFGGRLQVDW